MPTSIKSDEFFKWRERNKLVLIRGCSSRRLGNGMPKPIIKSSQFGFLQTLTDFWVMPRWSGTRSRKTTTRSMTAIVSTMSQSDVINILYLKDFVDLSWQIRRERLILSDR